MLLLPLADHNPLIRSLMPPGSHEQPANNEHDGTPGKEAEVVSELVWTRTDVMDAEKVMVHDALDEVEKTPADQQHPDKHSHRPRLVAASGRAPEEEKPGYRKKVGAGVEKAVAECVDLEARHGRDRVPVGNHVMPLKNLMQDDTVKEPTEA